MRIGAVISDSLLLEGLLSVLGETAELVSMSAPETLAEQDLAMVVLEAEDEKLFTMMAVLRRARPGLPLVVLGSRTDHPYVKRVVAAGAKGYLPHTASAREIEMAIEVVADGSIWAPRKVLASLIDTVAPGQERRAEIQFTPRERDVLQLLVAGRSNREIADTLQIELKTVKVHVGHLLQKLGVSNRVSLTIRVLELHLLQDSEQ